MWLFDNSRKGSIMLNRVIKIMTVFAVLGFFSACDGNHIVDSNEDVDPTLYSITVDAVSDGSSTIQIPIEIYGSGLSDLEGASVSIYVNGVLRLQGLSVYNLLHTLDDEIVFKVSPIKSGDMVGFYILRSDGSELYYEGYLSGDTATYASIAVFSDGGGNTDTPVADLFEEYESEEGSALGTGYTGRYYVYFDSLQFSEDCETDFIKTLGFFTNSSASDEDVDDMLINGGPVYVAYVSVAQSQGVLIWDNEDESEDDYVGVVYSTGSFHLFDGDYVDENNYSYTTFLASFDKNKDFSGVFTSTINMDGKKLKSGLTGSCTVTSEITGSLMEE